MAPSAQIASGHQATGCASGAGALEVPSGGGGGGVTGLNWVMSLWLLEAF